MIIKAELSNACGFRHLQIDVVISLVGDLPDRTGSAIQFEGFPVGRGIAICFIKIDIEILNVAEILRADIGSIEI